MKTYRRRKSYGSLIAEYAPALWLLLVMFMIPFLNLTTIVLRYTFLVSTSRDAAFAAARAKSFITDASTTQLSAVHLAQNQATTTAAAFTGITLTSVTTSILITRLTTGVVTRQTTVLTTPADTSNYLYQIETRVNGQVKPLITFSLPFFGTVPGLTGPMIVFVTSREYCEYPQGLTQ